MNLYEQDLMGRPSIKREYCVFCGRPATEQHHVVFRSQGGGKGPTVSVCGWGNTSGCHGLLHARKLHLRWREGWEYLRTAEPTKYDEALRMSGWRKLADTGPRTACKPFYGPCIGQDENGAADGPKTAANAKNDGHEANGRR